ncbi:MAG: alkaline phosphatase family protein [Desulfobacteraceae bacterium]|nr:alkaline phosphatase family protein [Desulfobacteraceae bacterium]
MGSFFALFAAFLSALATLLFWPIRFVIRTIRQRRAFSRSRIKKFVIVGLDGLDPILTKKFMDEGKLPNLLKLSEQGSFSSLASTIPPISPVAWSSFQTCSNPGKHNIFDFLTRDLKTYEPKLSSVDIRPSRKTIKMGKYIFPLGKPDIRLLRKGIPFWKILGEHGIFSNVIRVPITFPPEQFNGLQLSAMCVPDLRGSQGTYSFYSSLNGTGSERTGGEIHPVKKNGDTITGELTGPENPFRTDRKILKVPFTICLVDDVSVDLKIDGVSYRLKKKSYTEWIKVGFKAAPGIKVSGICKFLLINAVPEFEMYVSPINIDPEKPALKISHPAVYSTYFSKRIGPFATLGLAEDTWALNEKVLTDDTFLDQSLQIEKEREQMFFDALDKINHGFCICVFDGTDRIQHTFWRHIDKGHPANKRYKKAPDNDPNAIESVYRRMDDVVGKAMDRCDDKNTILMVISDHGFSSFRYGVDLNRWLEENGYLHVIETRRSEKYLSAIDWSKTKAFAIGLAGIFINIKGRESQGIVSSGEEAALLRKEISQKLSALRFSADGERVVENVYNALDVYTGPYKTEAPDLIVGYRPGYRASWDTAIGKVTDRVFHENTKAWSGDHCIDHSFVPGVLFCNRPVNSENPRIIDIGPTVMDMFGISTPKNMDGKPLKIQIH